MKAGMLTRRVKIQTKQSSNDGEPFPIGWEDWVDVWADVRILSGLETLKLGVGVSVIKASIRIRYREHVTAGMRVVYKGRVFDIRAVLPDVSGKKYLDLACESGMNQG